MKRPVKKRILGAFEIVKDLAAKGAQGKLYVGKVLEPCFDGLAVGDLVALKVMEVHDDDGERAFRRLKRRTDALVAAAHPGVVRYYGCFDASDESKDQHVIVMELLTGQTLEERLKENWLGLDSDEALRIITICADALVHVAEYGLVHRDIKPSNIFLCDNGGVKLIDFEIARQEGASRTTTESGAMRGTFDYMAPDFHPDYRPDKGFHGDECSDVFSLTVCLYEMLAGSRPYAVGGMMGEQSMMAYFQRWTKVAGTDVSKSLKIESYKIHALAHVQEVIRKGLSPERPGRYQSYLEFREALRQVKVREVASPGARYELLRCVGKGGFGVVFRARRKSDGLVVAIKVLLRAEYSERFTREAKALAKFHDDRLVSFVEYFSIARNASETYFIVMQFLEGMPGSSLRDRIAEANGRGNGAGRLRLREILIAFKRYAGGLKVLHDGGIIHRDIKPANLYMPEGAPERSCVMDLGVVKTDETQTNGNLPGTLDYMPPEMALGQSRGSPAVDIYALGLCLHEALTGEPLFPRLKRGDDGLAEFYRRAKEARPPDLSRLDQMPTWQSIVRNMTAHGVADRIGDCAIVMSLLDAVPEAEGGFSDEPETNPTIILPDNTHPPVVEVHGGGVSPVKAALVAAGLTILGAAALIAYLASQEGDGGEVNPVRRYFIAHGWIDDPNIEPTPPVPEPTPPVPEPIPPAPEPTPPVPEPTPPAPEPTPPVPEPKPQPDPSERIAAATSSFMEAVDKEIMSLGSLKVQVESSQTPEQFKYFADEAREAVNAAKKTAEAADVPANEVSSKVKKFSDVEEDFRKCIDSRKKYVVRIDSIAQATEAFNKSADDAVAALEKLVFAINISESPMTFRADIIATGDGFKKAISEAQANEVREETIVARQGTVNGAIDKANDAIANRKNALDAAIHLAAIQKATEDFEKATGEVVSILNGMIPDIGKSDQPGGFLPEVETQSNRFETAVASARGGNVPGDRIEAQRGMVADAVAKVRKAISEKQKQRDIEEQRRIAELRRKEALGKVREFEELRDDDMDTLTQTSDWDRGKYQAFSRKIDNDAAKAKAAKEAGTGYDDLNARLQRAVDGFADLRRKFDALHPVLALSNNMNVPVTYYVNGIGYEVLPNGGMDIAMKPCANARITAKVSGMLSPDYYETHEKVVELPGAGRVPFSDTPEFRGNPTVIVRNRNDVAITLSVDGGAGREVAAGNSIAIEGSPRSRCTIAYSAPENYEISGGIRAEATFGNAGTATDIFAPELTLLPRRVRMVNPLAESVVWTVSAGERRFKLDATPLEFNVPDGVDAVSISADPPDEELESEYRPVTESVSGFRRSRVATPLRFRAEQDMDAVERNRHRRQEKLEKEYASLRRRIKYAWPSDPSKTEQVADWMSVAEAVAKAMDARFDGMRDPDEVADWLRRFEDCHPESLQDKHGRRRDLEERLRIIRGR